jgi:hypothetical protein
MTTEKKNDKVTEVTPKKKYIKPEIVTEDLNVFGAACNGTSNGGRKASSSAPALCGANKLNS